MRLVSTACSDHNLPAIIVNPPAIITPSGPAHANDVQVSCGGMHSLVLTLGGEVLSWGANDEGALGRKTAFADCWQVRELESTNNTKYGPCEECCLKGFLYHTVKP